MNSVSCLTWIRRGAAKKLPDRVRLTEDDFSKLIKSQEERLQQLELGEADSPDEDKIPTASGKEDKVSVGRKRKRGTEVQSECDNISNESGEAELAESEDEGKCEAEGDLEKRYNLQDYDEVESDEEEENPLSLAGLTYYADNSEDPNLTHGIESDEEDLEVLPEDNMIAVGRIQGDFCNLEIYIYNETEQNLFCHHDTLLPTFPLCLEWLTFDPTEEKSGNFAAMGTMEPDIEIWDLDVVDGIEPAFKLTGAEKKTSKKKKKRISSSGHTDAVLDLAWNSMQKKILASASADFTVGLWDLEQCTMISSLAHHSEKVQTLQWHPFEAQTLLSGSYDKTIKLFDCRSPDSAHKSWTVLGEVERVVWNNHDPFQFLSSTDTGYLYCMDVRTDKPLFSNKAHSGAVAGLSISTSVHGLVVTAASDKILKVWDIRQPSPTAVFKKNLKMGEINCANNCPDSGLIFAVGGERELRVLNLKNNIKVCSHFGLDVNGKGNVKNDSYEEDSDIVVAADVENDVDPLDILVNDEVAATAKDKKKKKKKKSKKTLV